MGQKTNSYVFRLGINQVWNSNYFAKNKKQQVDWLKQDTAIRNYLFSNFPQITKVKIERDDKLLIYIYATDVALILGENNETLEIIMKNIYLVINDKKLDVRVNLIEIKEIYDSAQAIAQFMASQFKNRIRSQKVLNDIIDKVMIRKEIRGIKIRVKGIIDGNGIGQTKSIIRKQMPLNTICGDFDYGMAESITTRGKVGIKVEIYKGKKGIYARKNKI